MAKQRPSACDSRISRAAARVVTVRYKLILYTYQLTRITQLGDLVPRPSNVCPKAPPWSALPKQPTPPLFARYASTAPAKSTP
jgi:hypothetical protein